MISNIMIIDDNKIDLFIGQKIIEKYNPEIQVRSFNTAISALNFLKVSALKNCSKTISPPDLILLDINMPQMDGFEFMEAFKKMKLMDAAIKIVVLSSSLCHDDLDKVKNEQHCLGYVSKPITVDKLRDVIEKKSHNHDNDISGTFF